MEIKDTPKGQPDSALDFPRVLMMSVKNMTQQMSLDIWKTNIPK